MGANNHKVGSPINVWQSLGNVFINQATNLKAYWDQVGEIVRLKHDSLCDFIDTDIATKSELAGVTLGQIADGTITSMKLEATLKKIVENSLNPPGSIIAMASTTVPGGYLECNGALVSRTTYADLFASIGTTFGVGDGTTTFALPDLRGEFIRGWDNGKGTDIGRAFGSSQVATKVRSDAGWYGTPIYNGENPESIATDRFGGGSTTATTMQFAQVRPRNIALMYCIKH